MIPATPHLTCAAHFLDGFHDGIREAGVEGISVPGLYLNDDPEKFREAAHRLAASKLPPDGIVCGIEFAAIGLVAGLQDAGLVVGRDIDVIAKSTSDILDYVTPPIDSFHEDLLLAGETLAHFLMKRIGGVPGLARIALAEQVDHPPPPSTVRSRLRRRRWCITLLVERSVSSSPAVHLETA